MFSVVDIFQESQWLERLAGFPEKDVYYLPAYIRVCMENGEGYPYAAYYEDENGKVFYPFMERDISKLTYLTGNNEWAGYKDITTPYGYSGPLVNCRDDNKSKLLKAFRTYFNRYCQEKKIVSEFIRFHPLLENHSGYAGTVKTEFNRYTVAVDLQNGPEGIWENLSSGCRNRIRKAKKNNIQIDFSDSETDLEQFIRLYTLTMNKLKAKEYYYFSHEYFHGLKDHLKHTFILGNARVDGTVVASVIILFYGSLISYHLGSSDPQKLHLAPNNLLFFETARFGAENGYKYLHLGGGRGNDDSLLRFKLGFAPEGRKEFWVGQHIHLPDVYQRLESIWKNYNQGNDTGNKFFPIYRA